MEDCHLHPDFQSQYKDHLKKGNSSLAGADLDSAEQHFAAALKMVHVRDPTSQQYQREVEPLCKLGDVYSKRGQQIGEGGDFVKAAALYIAARARSKDEVCKSKIETAIKKVEMSFLKYVLDIHHNENQDSTEKHKKRLKEMRDQIKLEMETIDQQLDPYVHDEDDPRVKEIEEKRAESVRHLFEKIAQQRKEFINLLVEECIGLMGPPPCTYALIGLGSQATGLVTPYSDLEFAILVEEESEKCLVYFRYLTHCLHLKVVNLGETILPALGIKSLNDFYSENPLDSWYYDSVTPRGFAFDGSMPKASKTPLGRQGSMSKPRSELICTPRNMVSKLQDDAKLHLKEEYHLATILRNPCLVSGDQGLMDIYMDITEQILKANGGKMAQELAQEILKENMKIYKPGGKQSITSSMIDVKKDLYRFPAVAVECLALSSHIVPTTVWKTIEELENQQVISPNNAHHLTVLTSISAELRLRTYIANGGQKENLSALASMETSSSEHGQELSLQTNNEDNASALNPVFHIQSQKQLFRYYYTAIPLKRALSKLSEKKHPAPCFSNLYDNSPTVQGKMYFELCKYRLAINCYDEALRNVKGNDSDRIHLLRDLGDACHKVGDCQKAIRCYKQILQMYNTHGGEYDKSISYLEQALNVIRSTFGQNTAHLQIANTLNNLGLAYCDSGRYETAIDYFVQTQKMDRRIFDIYGIRIGKSEDATSFLNLGNAWGNLGDYEKAISYFEQALQINRSNYGQTAAHPQTANALDQLGSAWKDKGDYRKALSYHEQALQMRRAIHGQSSAHPDIALSFSNLGQTWYCLGDYRKAISYSEQALQMYESVYGHDQTKAYPQIATSLHNLGCAWLSLCDYKKAISYLDQALQMDRRIYGKRLSHPDIASALSNLGTAWSGLSDHRKALDYYEQALKMQRIIYGQTKPHLDIATSLKSVGAIWTHLGDYSKAISFFKQALEMRRSIHGQTSAHPDIASSISDLGTAWEKRGNLKKALACHEQALQMYRNVYGHNTEHPDIAETLSRLGNAWINLKGKEGKAITYYEQALQMFRNIYGHSTPHTDVASLLGNLGGAWSILGDYRKAVSYGERALQMLRRIHEQNAPHPEIARALFTLGLYCFSLGDHTAGTPT
ncbi:uncharacterized protein LOC144884560 [Branchiostoma floridae x Branchiostoma japonicum]